jgi:hypothetical protein
MPYRHNISAKLADFCRSRVVAEEGLEPPIPGLVFRWLGLKRTLQLPKIAALFANSSNSTSSPNRHGAKPQPATFNSAA